MRRFERPLKLFLKRPNFCGRCYIFPDPFFFATPPRFSGYAQVEANPAAHRWGWPRFAGFDREPFEGIKPILSGRNIFSKLGAAGAGLNPGGLVQAKGERENISKNSQGSQSQHSL